MSHLRLSPAEITELALLAIDAAVRSEGWHALCDGMADRLNARAVMILAYDLERHALPTVLGSRALRGPGGAALILRAARGDGQQDEAHYRQLARRKPGEVLDEHTILGLDADAPLPENPWREDVFAVTGGRTRCMMRLNDHGPFLDCIATHDAERHDRVPPLGHVADILYPILARALEASRVVRRLAKSYDQLMTLFDALKFGAAFVDARGRLILSNAAFTAMLRDRDGVAVSGGSLCATEGKAAGRLQAFLAAAGQAGTHPEQLTVTLPRRSSSRPIVLCAVAIRDADIDTDPAILLLALDPNRRAVLNGDGLAAFGLLTQAELAVCDLLIQGFDTRDIADRRGTELNTVRNQIKTATGKLSCNSRLDLLRLAIATTLPIVRDEAK